MPLAGYTATLPYADIQEIPAIASPQKLNSDRLFKIKSHQLICHTRHVNRSKTSNNHLLLLRLRLDILC